MSEFITIGTIISTHALKGEVKIYSNTDFKEERYKIGNNLYIKKNQDMIKVKVKSYRNHKGYDLVLFEGYEDINKVEQFIKCKVYVSSDNVGELDDDEYYYRELIECEILYQDKIIGTVTDVVNYGASDILVIRNKNQKEIMIPFVDDFIKDVDKANKKIFIEIIEGLLDNEN